MSDPDPDPAKAPQPDAIGIRQRGPVGWLNLGSLFETGFLAAISAATGARTTRREVLAALDPPAGAAPVFDLSAGEAAGEDFWLDYVADLGDGFAATHSIAWLVGRDHIGLGPPGAATPQPIPDDPLLEAPPEAIPGTRLPAGRLLVFGGDQVYPFATQTAYEDRTIGPWRAARPWQLDAAGNDAPRQLFSIPGNHDWYDGLGAYVRRFCQPGRWMGCWQVQQKRSYFAARLPHQCWLWGVDLAIEDDFDAPQLAYFQSCARMLREGDTLLLCVPTPAWIGRARQEGDAAELRKSWQAWNKIDLLAEAVRRHGGGARIGAILSGDLHHYSRYRAPDEPEAPQLITCGGGGAFLLGTTGLPDRVEAGGARAAEQVAAYPDLPTSRSLRRQVFRLPLRHWDFGLALGATMLTLAWYLDSAGPAPILPPWAPGFWARLWALLAASPVPVLLLAAVFAGFLAFARSGEEGAAWKPLLAAALHLLAQLALALLLAGALKQWVLPLLPGPMPQLSPLLALPLRLAALLVLMALALLAGWALAGLLFAAYLLAANHALGLHGLEVYSAQAIEDWKCFLRIRVHARGVTIYPVGLDRVCRDWRPVAPGAATAEAAKPAPAGALGRMLAGLGGAAARLAGREDRFADIRGTTHLYAPAVPLAPHLIEPPVEIERRGVRA